MGKKREMWNYQNGDAEKGIPQHIPKKAANQGLSKESELKEGKNEKNGKWDLPSDRHGTWLYSQEGKTGEPTVPREDQNSIIKGRDGLRRKRESEKERKKKIFSREKLSVNLW